jgi:hypothetical protein
VYFIYIRKVKKLKCFQVKNAVQYLSLLPKKVWKILNAKQKYVPIYFILCFCRVFTFVFSVTFVAFFTLFFPGQLPRFFTLFSIDHFAPFYLLCFLSRICRVVFIFVPNANNTDVTLVFSMYPGTSF